MIVSPATMLSLLSGNRLRLGFLVVRKQHGPGAEFFAAVEFVAELQSAGGATDSVGMGVGEPLLRF